MESKFATEIEWLLILFKKVTIQTSNRTRHELIECEAKMDSMIYVLEAGNPVNNYHQVGFRLPSLPTGISIILDSPFHDKIFLAGEEFPIVRLGHFRIPGTLDI